MHANTQQLIELHVQHELSRLTSDQLEKDIHTEVCAFLDIAGQQKLNAFVTASQIFTLLKQTAFSLPLSENIQHTVHQCVNAIYNDKKHEKHGLNSLINRKQIEAYLDKSLSMNRLREELVHHALNSEIYHEVVADLLYSGISRYLTESNAVTQTAQRVPGAKAMMKMGKGLMNKAAPKLEEKIETQVKKYIGIAMPDVIAQSEHFINHSITDDHIRSIALGIWESVENKPIAIARDYISEEDISDYTKLSYTQALTSRESNYVQSLYKTAIQAFYKSYGNKKINVLIEDLGLNADKLTAIIMGTAPTLIKALKDSGVLEARLRARFTDFYESVETQTLLSS